MFAFEIGPDKSAGRHRQCSNLIKFDSPKIDVFQYKKYKKTSHFYSTGHDVKQSLSLSLSLFLELPQGCTLFLADIDLRADDACAYFPMSMELHFYEVVSLGSFLFEHLMFLTVISYFSIHLLLLSFNAVVK